MDDMEQKRVFSKNLNYFLDKRQVSQAEVANAIGVSPQTFNTWAKGIALPRMGKIQRLADYFGINKTDLIDYRSEPDLSGVTNIIYPAAYPVPILGTICAGNGVWCEDNYEGVFFIDKSIKADMCLNVHGDSMEDAEIHDGDIAFIRKVYDYDSGKIYAVRINDETEAVLKVVHWNNDNIVLTSRNAKYPPIIESAKDVLIIGECVGVYHEK